VTRTIIVTLAPYVLAVGRFRTRRDNPQKIKLLSVHKSNTKYLVLLLRCFWDLAGGAPRNLTNLRLASLQLHARLYAKLSLFAHKFSSNRTGKSPSKLEPRANVFPR
jgi:cytochrome b561